MKKYVLIFVSLFYFSSALASEKDFLTTDIKRNDKMSAETNFQARQISDPILHSIPKPVNFDEKDKINSCIEIMQNTLKNLGGVGISCNQCFCEDQLQIILIGTDDSILKEQAKERYPDETIPNLTIMINPNILEYSDDTFSLPNGEACLSVLSSMRGKVLRHQSVKIEYYNINGEKINEKYSGFAACIVQHEIDHLNGIVFLQKIFDKCSQNQKNQILDLIDKEINYRRINNIDVEDLKIESGALVFDFDINNPKKIVIDFEKLEEIFKEMLNTTLLGIRELL